MKKKLKKSLLLLFLLVLIATGAFAFGRDTALANFVVNAWQGYKLTQGLIGYWSMDGKDVDLSLSTAEIRDRSGQGNNGDWLNHATTTVTGKIGQAVNLDGTDDEIRLSDINAVDGASAVTISAWIKTNALVGAGTIGDSVMSKHVTTDHFDFHLTSDSDANCVNDNAMSFELSSAAVGGCSPANTHEAGVWEHWTVVYDGTQTGNANRLKMYKNGTQQTLTFVGTIGATLGSNSDSIYIGSDGGNWKFNGSLDDVRLYTRPLSADEVKRLYLMGASTKMNVSHRDELTSGLVGYWTMDGKDIDLSQVTAEVRDSSGVGNNADWRNHSTTTSIGKIGQAVTFDGTDDRMRISTPTSLLGLSTMTVCAWVYPIDSGDNYPVIFSTYDVTNATGWDFYLYNASNFPTGVGLGTSFGYTGFAYVNEQYELVAIPFNAWSFVCASQNGNLVSNMKLYANAVEISGSEYGAGTRLSDSGNPANIGIGENGAGPFSGSIDDVRVYNRELTLNEIKRLYQMGASARMNVSHRDELASGLIGYWTFDGKDMEPNIRDVSGTGNHGGLQGQTPTTTAMGKVGQGMSFDGSNDYVYLGSAASLDDIVNLTACAWSNPTGLTDGSILSKDDSVTGWSISDNSTSLNSITFYRGWTGGPGYGNWRTPDGSFPKNTWTHVCVTYNDSSTTNDPIIYINGSPVTLVEDNAPSGTLISDNTFTAAIGSYGLGLGGFFSGQVDDARIYNRILSADEVKRLYLMGR